MSRNEYAARRKQELAQETAVAICRVHAALRRFWGNNQEPAYWVIFVNAIPMPIRLAMSTADPDRGGVLTTIRASDIDIGGLMARLEDRLLRYRRVTVAPIYLKTLVAAIEADIGACPVITSTPHWPPTTENDRVEAPQGSPRLAGGP